MSVTMREQYEEIISAIDSQGLDYALVHGGYIRPDTNDERLNAAITKAVEGLKEIEQIIAPYRI